MFKIIICKWQGNFNPNVINLNFKFLLNVSQLQCSTAATSDAVAVFCSGGDRLLFAAAHSSAFGIWR